VPPNGVNLDWTVIGGVAAVIGVVTAIIVPIELHRRKERSDRRIREKAEQRKRRDDRLPIAEAILKELDASEKFVNNIDLSTSVTERELLDFRGSATMKDLKEHLVDRRMAEFYSTTELKRVVQTVVGFGLYVPPMPSVPDLQSALEEWANEEDAEPLHKLLLKMLDADHWQRAITPEWQTNIKLLRDATERALAEDA
jgi:hypothetical protein